VLILGELSGVESTVVEVLILNGFGEGGISIMVNLEGRKILVEFERPRGREA
jgi:hypothetical protein